MRAVVIERPTRPPSGRSRHPPAGRATCSCAAALAGVCRTDLEVLEGELDRRWVTYPCIPGHEWSGVVEAGRRGRRDLAPGDRVVCEGFCYCGVCRRCRAGDTNLCESYDQLGFTRGGGYGELVVAPRRVVHALPENVALDAAVLIEPGSVVLKGLERARPRPGETIGVVGVGTLGALDDRARAAVRAGGDRRLRDPRGRARARAAARRDRGVDVSGGARDARGRARPRRRDRGRGAGRRARDAAAARGRADRRARDRRRGPGAERPGRPVRPARPRADRQRRLHDRRLVAASSSCSAPGSSISRRSSRDASRPSGSRTRSG